VCRRVLRQNEDVEDAFQATFLVLARKAGSGCWRESVGPWLHETARRVALRSKETAARRRLLENQQVANCQTSTPARVACEELCGILDEELQRLPQAYKAPLVLCYLEGRSQDQVARQLGWTLRTLQRRLEQARDRLRARLVRRGVTLSAALLAGALTEETALAALSSRLTTVTTRAAAAFASGSGAGGISAPVLALAQSTLRALALTRLKVVLSIVLVSAGLALAGGAAIHQALFTSQQEKKQESQSPLQIKKSGEKTAKEDIAASKDLFGDLLPKGALARLGSLRFRHTGYLYGVRYSPDGKVLATTDALHLYLWRADTGELIRKEKGVCVFAFSEDGKMLAGADYEPGDKDWRTMRVCIWNTATGEEVHRFKKSVANGRWVRGLNSPVIAFAPDNKSLASAWDDGTVRIWEIPTGKELLKLDVEALGLAFSPDGKKLAIIGGRELGLWDPGTGEEIQKFEGEHGTLVAFSRDGKMLASTEKGRGEKVKLWDPATGSLLWQSEQFDPQGFVSDLTFSHDGKMLAAGGFGDTAVRIWDLANDKQMRKLKGVPRFVNSLDFAPDGETLVLGGNGLVLQRWDPGTGTQLGRKEEQDDYIQRLAFSPDNTLLATAGLGSSVRLWDSGTGKALGKLEELDAQATGGISPLAFAPDGKSLVAIGGGKKGASAEERNTIVLWNLAEGQVRHRFEMSGRVFITAAFSPDGRALATAEHRITQHLNPFTHKDSGVVRLWNPVSGEQTWKVTLAQPISALAFSPDGKMLAVGGEDQKGGRFLMESEGRVRLLNASTGKASEAPLSRPSGRVRLLDASTGKETHSWQTEVPVTALAFLPQGEVLITSPDGMLRDVATGRKLRLLEYEKTDKDGFAWPRALAVSPDGRMLATRNSPRTIGVWEIASGRQRYSLTHFSQAMEHVAFSPDGKRLATTCGDGTALIWDVTGPK
jgi:RNA polymerase sigma factor (sigma-70 family)